MLLSTENRYVPWPYSGSSSGPEEAQEQYRTSSSYSTFSSASDTSSAVTRTDVSPLSLNGLTSSRETSPAASNGSGKIRRSSETFGTEECEHPRDPSGHVVKRCKTDSESPENFVTPANACGSNTKHEQPSAKKSEICPLLRMSRSRVVEILVDAAVSTISSIWGRFSRESRAPDQVGVNRPCPNNTLPLALFVREILRRSRTSCSTLQAALLYCSRCKEAVHDSVDRITHASPSEVVNWLSQSEVMTRSPTNLSDPSAALPSLSPPCAELLTSSHSMSNTGVSSSSMRASSPLLCGRRMFLAAIVVASKFLQDRTYSNRTWAKISGLPSREIEQLERVFLHTIQYNLYVDEAQWAAWTRELSLQRLHSKLPCMLHESDEAHEQAPMKSSSIPSRLHRATSENVLGQAYQFDSSLHEPQLPARSRQGWARHGSSL